MAYLSEVTLSAFEKRHPALAQGAAAIASTIKTLGQDVSGLPLYSERLLFTAVSVRAAKAAILQRGEYVRAHPYFRGYTQAFGLDDRVNVNAGSANSQAGPANTAD